MTAIAAVCSAFPEYRYPQVDFTEAVAALAGPDGLGPAQRALLERLHVNAGVSSRHTVLPLAEYETLGDGSAPRPGSVASGEVVNDRYIEEATALGERALRSALASCGLAADDLDLLIVTSVTGVAVPSLDARLIPRLGLRPDIKRLPVFGLGCVAGAAGLARLHDYLLAWPRHAAALLAVELCSLSWPRESVTTADMVASALFGDGAVALIGTGAQRGMARLRAEAALAGTMGSVPAARAAGVPGAGARLPRVVATRSEVYPDSGDTLGWRLGPEGFRIVLTAELTNVVERRLSGSVTGFLSAHGLTVDDIKTWICHPGGPKVLDAVERSLKLPASALATSRRSLAEVGNMSSASVLHILELTAADCPAPPGSYGLLIGLGPGVSAELVLLRW